MLKSEYKQHADKLRKAHAKACRKFKAAQYFDKRAALTAENSIDCWRALRKMLVTSDRVVRPCHGFYDPKQHTKQVRK